MAHLQYMPGDPRLVDQLVYELKSKGIFDQFRKDCIADVDTRPAYQNLRQRVENSVSTFLSRQCWKPDLNKNQLREKLRKHVLDGNYLEQGVERIVDQVVNPKVATVFIPQVEDLVYNYLGIPRKKAPAMETNERTIENLLPTDLEAVSPGSVKSNEDKGEPMDTDDTADKDFPNQDEQLKQVEKKLDIENKEVKDVQMSEVILQDSFSMDKSAIPLPTEEIKLENIPAPENSPPKVGEIELESIALPCEPNFSTDIPLPEETTKIDKGQFFGPVALHSEDSNSSSDSSLRRNMSPLTPIRNFNNENSYDAQQGFEDDSDTKSHDKTVPSSFRFVIENNDVKTDSNVDIKVIDKKEAELSNQFNSQVNINTYNTPTYEDSSNSNNLHIDYESDVNSKTNIEMKIETENSQEFKKEKKTEDKKSSHKSSHKSRDSSRHSSSKDNKKSESKHSASRDSSRHDKKSSSKDDKSKSSKENDRSKDRNDRKESRDSSKNRSSHKSSSQKDKDSKSHRSSSANHRHSSKGDDKKSSSSKDKEKISESSRDKSSKDKSRDSKSSSHRSDKDRKNSSSSNKKTDDKDKKKDKKDIDDHYSSSGRGNHGRRSTDRDSNDGSSCSKGSHNHNGSKTSENKRDGKSSSSKSDNTSVSGDSTSPSDKDQIVLDNSEISQCKPVIRVDNHLETPIVNPPRLPFVPDVTLKKPRFAANLKEAKKLMKMRKFLDEEQKRMNQEAALLLEFQANVRPNLSQVYSSIPGPELEFACMGNKSQDPPNDDNHNQSALIDKEINPAVVKKDTETRKSVEIADALEEKHKPVKEANVNENKDMPQENIQDDITLIESDIKTDSSYDENKPFSELMDEIKEYSKASEDKYKIDDEADKEMYYKEISTQITQAKVETDNDENAVPSYFEVTIITEVVSENEEFGTEAEATEEPVQKNTPEESLPNLPESEFQYFAEHEKYNAELKKHEYNVFLKSYIEAVSANKKMYVINCDTYEESIVKEMASTFGNIDVINYYKNGCVKLPVPAKNLVKDVTLSTEVTLPIEATFKERTHLFSPVKSDCSFELSSEYDTKMEDINKKSRQEVMEIILGSIVDASPSKMPKIDYYTECDVEIEENEYRVEERDALKRSVDEVESSVNNNSLVFTPNKMRRLSDTDQITSTTQETEEASNNNKATITRSKYLGRARRVGLPRPRRSNLSNSPSSDKSVENYAQNTPAPTPNGKIKNTPRSKVQRYDKSDLYKPKLHYLSRRNNIS